MAPGVASHENHRVAFNGGAAPGFQGCPPPGKQKLSPILRCDATFTVPAGYGVGASITVFYQYVSKERPPRERNPQPRRMESKNSEFAFVCLTLSTRNSVASSSSIG